MPARLALPLFVAAASLAPAWSQPELTSASRVCVIHRGGFVMAFDLWNTATNVLSRWSPFFSSGVHCVDLSATGSIKPGDPVVTRVFAESGTQRSLPPLLYSPASDSHGVTAIFTCMGSTRIFSCTLNGETTDDQPGAVVAFPAPPVPPNVHAKRICLQNNADFMMKVRLWDTATGALGAWSEGFDMGPGGNGGEACVDGGSVEGVASGHPLVVIIGAEGTLPALTRSFLYDPNATSSTQVECWGSRQSYSCALLGASRRLEVLV